MRPYIEDSLLSLNWGVSVNSFPRGGAGKGGFCQANALFLFSDDSLNAGLAVKLMTAKFKFQQGGRLICPVVVASGDLKCLAGYYRAVSN